MQEGKESSEKELLLADLGKLIAKYRDPEPVDYGVKASMLGEIAKVEEKLRALGVSISELRLLWPDKEYYAHHQEGMVESTENKESENAGQTRRLRFSNGSLSVEEVEAILDSLPIGFVYVDKNDDFKYFNAKKEIPQVALDRKTQPYHPISTIPALNLVLKHFKRGAKDPIEIFGSNYKGRQILGWWIPVTNKKGEYLGLLDLDLDITEAVKGNVQQRDQILERLRALEKSDRQ